MSCICQNIIKTTSVAIVAGKLVLTIPTTTFDNLEKFRLCICQDIPSGAGTLPVAISNGTTVSAFTRFGNILRADQLRTKGCYCFVYGNDAVHYAVTQPLPCSGFVAVVAVASEEVAVMSAKSKKE